MTAKAAEMPKREKGGEVSRDAGRKENVRNMIKGLREMQDLGKQAKAGKLSSEEKERHQELKKQIGIILDSDSELFRAVAERVGFNLKQKQPEGGEKEPRVPVQAKEVPPTKSPKETTQGGEKEPSAPAMAKSEGGEKGETGKGGEKEVPPTKSPKETHRGGKREASLKKQEIKDISDVWNQLQEETWPSFISPELRRGIEGKVAHIEPRLQRAIEEKDFENTEKLIDHVQEGLHTVVEGELKDAPLSQLEQTRNFIQKNVIDKMRGLLHDLREKNKIAGEITALRKTVTYNRLRPAFDRFLRARDWIHAGEFIPKMGQALHAERNGTVSPEAYKEFLDGLQQEVRDAIQAQRETTRRRDQAARAAERQEERRKAAG